MSDWLRKMADKEDNGVVSVGGLITRIEKEMELYSIFWKGRLFARTKAENADVACDKAFAHVARHQNNVDRKEFTARLSSEEEKVMPGPQ